MDKTQAYQCLGTQDPLPNLIQRTNRYLTRDAKVSVQIVRSLYFYSSFIINLRVYI